MRMDLGKKLKFPPHITLTSLRPDIVLSSASSRQVLLIEPLEDCIEGANEQKWSKYQKLVKQYRGRLESKLRTHWSRVHRLCWSLTVQCLPSAWYHGGCKKESHIEHHGGNRESLWMTLD